MQMSLAYRLKFHIPIFALCRLWFFATAYDNQIKILRVVDRDTIKVTNNGTTSTIRLVGIDAPEKSREKMNLANHIQTRPLNTWPARS